jgi:hypothetical protein
MDRERRESEVEIFRTEDLIVCESGEKFQGGDWLTQMGIKVREGMILAGVTDEEHDGILNMADGLDPLGLRGYIVQLLIDTPDKDDPKEMNLPAIPVKGQVLRHQDRYYLVKLVVQSTSCGVAAFVAKLSHEALELLTS